MALPQFLQQLGRFLQKNLAEFPQQLFIPAQALQSFGFVPQQFSAQERLGRGGSGMGPLGIDFIDSLRVYGVGFITLRSAAGRQDHICYTFGRTCVFHFTGEQRLPVNVRQIFRSERT